MASPNSVRTTKQMQDQISHYFDCFRESLQVGMPLEVYDPNSGDVLDCVVSRLQAGYIWIVREDRTQEELADVCCLQPAGESGRIEYY